MADADDHIQHIQRFIDRWLGTAGGAERANYQLFLSGFCQALGLDAPAPAVKGVLGDYQFEGPVAGGSAAGNKGFVDLYRRARFVLEAKQSLIPADKRDRPELFDIPAAAPAAPSGAKYDRLMRDALTQARHYAVNLPADHPWPPFIIVCDVGRAFEIYYDWSGNGRGYAFFPDKQSYRVTLDRIADPAVQALFRAIWNDPASIDPRARAAEVTRDVAKRLAAVSRWLEETQRAKTAKASDYERSRAVEETSLFLMRLLFCMFAEDVGLLPKGRFTEFLEDALEDDRHFQNGLQDLWKSMGEPHRSSRWAWAVKDEVRYFNGGLFADSQTYVLGRADRGELLAAAKSDWRRVEPAIFGTLLEQALTASERAKLGAHYTPRPYVERLVQATIMDVLAAEWEAVQATAGDASLLAAATAFHTRLAGLRILDPACGTGNFLYVAMELLLRLEGDVIELIAKLGRAIEPAIGPQNFYGLELNPRAAVIAELVLWIGWLRWRTANDPHAVPEPVLRRTQTINFGGHAGYDAVLTHTATGEADTAHPAQPAWPEADFIVGNPPFIGKGSVMRFALGDDYVEALWRAHPNVPRSADLVMFWWDHAATLLTEPGTSLRRFGFVTTNSISGSFNRRVVARHLNNGASLVFAVADHPWTKASADAAAVRIAMTACEAGSVNGELFKVVLATGLRTDAPSITMESVTGKLNADLTVGTDATAARALLANVGIASNGMLLAGRGFVLSRSEAELMMARDGLASKAIVRPYMGGSELLRGSRGRFVIDFFGLSEQEARKYYPTSYQHLLDTVKPTRDLNNRASYKSNWWMFAEPRRDIRPSFVGLSRYIATVETARHRIFQFVEGSVVPDHMIIAFAFNDYFYLGVMSSSVHLQWTLSQGGTLEDRPRYNKSLCFDPFPFPAATPAQRAAIAAIAEELDATRKAALAETPGLTMTELYNLRDLKRRGTALDAATGDRAVRARAGIVAKLHDELDAAVAAAYGWPGGLAPSEIITRLVALNAERAAEEAAGKVRWLRPDYQIPRFAKARAAGATTS